MKNKQQHLPGRFLHLDGCFHSQKVVIVANKVHLHPRIIDQVNFAQKTHYQSPKFFLKHELACMTSSARVMLNVMV